MAGKSLCRDPQPDASARRTEHPADVPVAGPESGELLSPLGESRTGRGGDGVAQRPATAGPGARHYGYRRITVLLRRQGLMVGTKKVRRLMREDNLLAIRYSNPLQNSRSSAESPLLHHKTFSRRNLAL